MPHLGRNTLPTFDYLAGHGVSSLARFGQSRPRQSVSRIRSRCKGRSIGSVLHEQHRTYATSSITSEERPSPPLPLSSSSPVKIRYPFTAGQHPSRHFQAPTKSEIKANLRPPPSLQTVSGNRSDRNNKPSLQVGTVTKVGTMNSTVQISYNQQSFDNWFKRHIQRTLRIRAHEPSGYLRQGDVVQFARFSPATMAERYESGKLDRRGGGVRYEVHRVVTPFGGQAVADRKEKLTDGKEVGDRFGDVEFERRQVDLTRPWNADGKRRVAVVEAMHDAVQMEVDRLATQVAHVTALLDASKVAADVDANGSSIPPSPNTVVRV